MKNISEEIKLQNFKHISFGMIDVFMNYPYEVLNRFVEFYFLEREMTKVIFWCKVIAKKHLRGKNENR
jgi:hypothetical protein